MKINRIMKIYNDFVLDIGNISFAEVGLVGVIGKKGTGKSTLINVLAGKIKAEIESVKILGEEEIFQNSKLARQEYLLSEESKFEGKLGNIIKDFAYIYTQFDYDECNKIMQNFSLNIKMKFKELAIGKKVQFGLAILCALPIKIVFLDDILSNIDIADRQIVYDNIKIISKKKLVIFSSHILGKDMEFFDRVLLLDNGKIKYDIKNGESIILDKDGEYRAIKCSDVDENITPIDIFALYKNLCTKQVEEDTNGEY